jgi:hypothetical protein
MRLLPLFGIVIFLFYFSVVPVMAADDDNIAALKGVVTGAFDDWFMKQADGLVKDSKLVSANNTSDEARVGVFDFITAPITILENENFKKAQEDSLPIFIILAKDLVIIVALLALIQLFDPEAAGGITEFFHGRATYYEPKDVLRTGRNLALWFLCGPGLLVAMIWLCNNWVGRMDTSVLDQVVISSDNFSNYVVFGAASKGLKFYMSIRTTVLLYIAKHWYYLGIMLAWKKTRWVGVLLLEYMAVQIFTQPVLVSMLTETVGFTLEGGFGLFLVDMVAYGGLVILMFCICFVAFTSPIWIKLFSPNTLRFIIQSAKHL